MAGCAGASSSPSPSAPPGPSPAASPLPGADLKYRLIDQLGRPLFCDPDFYPVARADEGQLAAQHFAEIQSDPATFAAILAHLNVAGSTSFSDAQKLAIYREWKTLRAITLQPTGDRFRFDLIAQPPPAPSNGTEGNATRFDGTITNRGVMAIELQVPAQPPMCPICLARGTRIVTPEGEVAVEDLRVGDAVWTADANGNRVPASVLAVGSMIAPADHHVVHLVLADGRELWASPGHPLPDGRRLGDLRVGDLVDGGRVVATGLVPYAGGSTFDLLPSGPTGSYWADGILLGSTLGP